MDLHWSDDFLWYALFKIIFGGSDGPHTPHSPRCGIVDIFAFLIIVVTARRLRTNRHPDMPSVLDSILRDATIYFMVIFASQFLFLLFRFFAPVGDI